jgi:NRPS condensation-like uncharacterized protein
MRGSESPSSVPLSEIDLACAASEDAFGPFNIEVAVETRGRLDVERLRRAVARASRRHFLCGARRNGAGLCTPGQEWVRGPDPVVDAGVVRSASGGDREDQDAERDDLLAEPIPLQRTPPFRLLLSQGADGDLLTLSASHVASDGLGALHLLRTIAAEYAGRSHPPHGVGYLDARRFLATLAASARARPLRRPAAPELAPLRTTHLAASAAPPSPGSGVHHHRIAWVPGPPRRRPTPTLNDVLAVALLRAIEEHNARRGRSCATLSILVPLNLRPRAWGDAPMGNFSLAGLLVSRPHDRLDPTGFLAAVASRSRLLRADRAGAGRLALLRAGAALPWMVRDAITRIGFACESATPTAILSNFGRVEGDLGFEADAGASALWASPPCRPPCSLGVGVLHHAGHMHLSFRYRREVLCRADVERIARRMSVEASELARLR